MSFIFFLEYHGLKCVCIVAGRVKVIIARKNPLYSNAIYSIVESESQPLMMDLNIAHQQVHYQQQKSFE